MACTRACDETFFCIIIFHSFQFEKKIIKKKEVRLEFRRKESGGKKKERNVCVLIRGKKVKTLGLVVLFCRKKKHVFLFDI